MAGGPVELVVAHSELPLAAPFRISGHEFRVTPVVTVTLRRNGHEGRGEAAGVYYMGDTPARAVAAIEAVRPVIEAGITRLGLRDLLPPGGARNAVDCALWELEARQANTPVTALAGVGEPRPLLTTMTLGADSPAAMAAGAAGRYGFARAIKIKLTGDVADDVARVAAVRAARPDVWLGVDANQGYTPATLADLLDTLMACEVQLLEQPFRRGAEAEHDEMKLPLPVAADESCLDLAELATLAGRFDVVNIKLDKCGGLTEGLMIARAAKALGLRVMVGNMMGSSLAAAPAFVLGQLCDIVDLDGPVFLAADVVPGIVYPDGMAWCSPQVWGHAAG